MLRNHHSPIDSSVVTGPNNWFNTNSLSNLWAYLHNDTRVADWEATEYLEVHGAEYLGGFIADTQTDCTMVPGTFGRIEIAELQWRPSSSSVPDSFSLAPLVVAGVDGRRGDERDDGVSLKVVGLSSGSGRVEFRAELPTAMKIQLELYDISGRRVRTLAKGDAVRGSTDIGWDGRDGNGRAAASGVYFARLACRAGVRTVGVPLIR
jgi:hypothetical protein